MRRYVFSKNPHLRQEDYELVLYKLSSEQGARAEWFSKTEWPPGYMPGSMGESLNLDTIASTHSGNPLYTIPESGSRANSFDQKHCNRRTASAS